jgi:hypothetical protein
MIAIIKKIKLQSGLSIYRAHRKGYPDSGFIADIPSDKRGNKKKLENYLKKKGYIVR